MLAKLPHQPRRLAYRSGSRPSTTRLPCLIPRLYRDGARDLTARLSASPALGLSPLTPLPPTLRPSALSDKESSHQFFVPDPLVQRLPRVTQVLINLPRARFLYFFRQSLPFLLVYSWFRVIVCGIVAVLPFNLAFATPTRVSPSHLHDHHDASTTTTNNTTGHSVRIRPLLVHCRSTDPIHTTSTTKETLCCPTSSPVPDEGASQRYAEPPLAAIQA